METVTIQKAKTQLSRLIKKTCQGEEIIIARGTHPVVKLVRFAGSGDGTADSGPLEGKDLLDGQCI